MVEGGLMEHEEPLDSELAAREDIAMMREQIARMRRSLGALEDEVRLRENEFIAIRSARRVEEWETD
jgi:hypothetical protein